LSQAQIVKLLKKGKLTTREIEEIIKISRPAINQAIKQLMKFGEVACDKSNWIPVYFVIEKKKKKVRCFKPHLI